MGNLVDIVHPDRLHQQRQQPCRLDRGAGLEYAFTNNFLGRVEYRYTNLGTISYVDPVTASSDIGNKLVINDIRAGLAFKFGGGYRFHAPTSCETKASGESPGLFPRRIGDFHVNARRARAFPSEISTTKHVGVWNSGDIVAARRLK